jgi:hypothetical protein
MGSPVKLESRERYVIGEWEITTGLYGGWSHRDYDGAPDAGPQACGHGMGTYGRACRTTFHDCLTEIAEWEENQ